MPPIYDPSAFEEFAFSLITFLTPELPPTLYSIVLTFREVEVRQMKRSEETATFLRGQFQGKGMRDQKSEIIAKGHSHQEGSSGFDMGLLFLPYLTRMDNLVSCSRHPGRFWLNTETISLFP